MTPRLVAVVALTLAGAGCKQLGFTNRVLHRVPSPDGQLNAVCQEIPAFDGPGYDVRLEGRDGSVVLHLYQIGDGDPCSEVAWSPDGRLVAVLSAHVARVRFADVRRALAERTTTTRWFWPQIDFGSEGHHTFGRDIRFTTPSELEVTTCPYDLRETQRARGVIRCNGAETQRHARAPL